MPFRPTKFDQFIGQDRMKKNLKISIQASKMRKESVPHILLHGGSGLGKTTIANVIGNELRKRVVTILSTSIDSIEYLSDTLLNLRNNEILFIDEIHALPRIFQESMYRAMEDYITTTKRTVFGKVLTEDYELKHFICIGATTELGNLATPFRERFGQIISLQKYSQDEINLIVGQSAKSKKIRINGDAVENLGFRSRMNPRTANRLLDRCHDYMTVDKAKVITAEHVDIMLETLGIDHSGLTDYDIDILETILLKFGGGPVGLRNLSSSTSIDEKAIQDIYEPWLLELGLIEKTSRGRLITLKGEKYLDLKFVA